MDHSSIPDFPFSVLALAPFTMEASSGMTAELLVVDPLDIDQALAAIKPSFFLSLPIEECPAGGMQLQFRKMQDFTPDGLLKSQPYLQDLLEADNFCREAGQQKKSQQDILTGLGRWPGLPPIALTQQKEPADEKRSPLDNILSMVALPEKKSGVQIDTVTEAGSYGALACKILKAIYSDPNFRSLESCWQGLRYLGCYLAKVGGSLSILSVSRENLEEILEGLREKVINNPPSLLLLDRAFTSSERSVQALVQLAHFGQEMLVPILTWLDVAFFQIADWQKLDRLSFLPHHLEGASFAKYRRFQESDSSRWLGLTCNRFLNRFPYGSKNRSRLLPFKEKALPWLSPVWAGAALMASSVKQSGWPTGMASSRHHPLKDLALDMEGLTGPSPLEVQFNENRLEQLSRCGIMPLASRKGTDTAFLAGDIMASADISLSYQTLVCRVSHFILWCRDHWQDSFQADELEGQLRTAFQLFTEKQGTSLPAGELTVKCRDNGEEIQVSFRWSPSRKILPVGQDIVLEFTW